MLPKRILLLACLILFQFLKVNNFMNDSNFVYNGNLYYLQASDVRYLDTLRKIMCFFFRTAFSTVAKLRLLKVNTLFYFTGSCYLKAASLGVIEMCLLEYSWVQCAKVKQKIIFNFAPFPYSVLWPCF